MFERYDEAARRTLFYARYEATQLGARSIETEHMLLGLIREGSGHAAKVLGELPLLDMRKDLESRRTQEKVLPSIEIPFTAETKRVLEYACQEADRFAHRHIGPEHLLLGLMREEDSFAAATLLKYGMRLDDARARIDDVSNAAPSPVDSNAEALRKIEQIEKLATDLNTLLSYNPELAMRAGLLLMDLQALKSLLDDQQ